MPKTNFQVSVHYGKRTDTKVVVDFRDNEKVLEFRDHPKPPDKKKMCGLISEAVIAAIKKTYEEG